MIVYSFIEISALISLCLKNNDCLCVYKLICTHRTLQLHDQNKLDNCSVCDVCICAHSKQTRFFSCQYLHIILLYMCKYSMYMEILC